MSVKVRLATVIILLALPLALLQGCGSSSPDNSSGGATGNVSGLNLQLSTVDGILVLIADGVSNVEVQMLVATQSGQPQANTAVAFTTTAGTFADGSSEMTVNTDADGMASVVLFSSTEVESAVVSAAVNTFKQGITIDFIRGFPASMTLRSSDNLVAVDQGATLVATVRDANDDPLPGITVTFSIAVQVTGSSVSPLSVKTDLNGRAQTTYTAGSIPGTDTLEAEVGTADADNPISAATSIAVQETDDGVSANDIQLLVSDPQLDSDGVETVILTALVRDFNNNLLPGVVVTFTADSGAIQVTRDTTDDTGTAEAVLGTGGDPTNRTIEVSALSGVLIAENTVDVTGTEIVFSGNNSLGHGEATALSLILRDSSGAGIADQSVALTAIAGNASINASGADEQIEQITTGFNGQAIFDVHVFDAGVYTVQATALGATSTFNITVNAAEFTFVEPEELTEVFLTPDDPDNYCDAIPTPQGCLTVTVHFEQDGISLTDGSEIEFTTTRGVIIGDATPIVDASGNASAVVRASNAGLAEITAICRDPHPDMAGDACDGEPTIQRIIEFVAENATTMNLEASPTSIGVNTGGTTNEQSTITAIVRDAANNLVKNKRIDFTLSDITGGTISPAFAVTDSFGRASTVYTAGSAPSSSGGVRVTATVNDPDYPTPVVTADVTLTVADKALFIKVGTANTIFEEEDVLYRYPYSVSVIDASGNSVSGVVVELSATSTQYQKGEYVFNFISERWEKFSPFTCPNEDTNNNGILDPGEDLNCNGVLDPGEDLNGNGDLDHEDTNCNGQLEPGDLVAVPESVTTNENGFGFFDLLYAQEFTWVQIRLTARASVAGTESESSATFYLQGSAQDFNSIDIVPPGRVSPFGIAPGCDNTD